MSALELVVAALEVHRAAAEQQAQDRDGLLEALRSFRRGREVEAVGAVLGGMATDTDAELDAAGRQVRQRGHDAGQDRGMAVHDVGHERAHLDALGGSGCGCQCRPAFQQRIGQLAAADEVVPGPHRAEAGGLGPTGGGRPPRRPDADDRGVDADRQMRRHVPAQMERPASRATSIMRSVAFSRASRGR